MAEKKHAGRRRTSRLYYRLTLAGVTLLMLGGLGVVGWFIWSTVNDVVSHNDDTVSIKVQGINTEALVALEKRDQERREGSAPKPGTRDPFLAQDADDAAAPGPSITAFPPTIPATAAAKPPESMPDFNNLR